MADNTLLNAGTGGDTIASDDIGGIKFQRVKPTIGADGTAVDVVPVSNGMDVTGTAVPSAGLVGQLDDTSTGTVTENQFAPVRISSRRALLVEGVASGTAVSTNLTQVAGSSVSTAATGIPKVGATDSLGQVQYNFPAGFVRTSDEPRQIFYDPFDAALDTTNRWNAATSSGGGVAASVSAGVLTLGSGTTINGYSYLASQASFVPTIPAWLGNSWAIQLEASSPAGINAVRFWGAGLVIGTPTSAAPLGTGNGYGFKIGTDGVLKAVVYAAGTETIVADLSASQPSDGAYHRYIIYYRTDRIYWYIDSLATPAATSSFQGPQVQTLPVLALSVAHSSAPAASRVITCAGLAVWDTGKNAVNIADGTYPWRKTTVGSNGGLVVQGVAGGTAVPVSLATLPVTNAGTFAVQVSTINAVAPAFGTGVRGATVQRVTIATDDVVPAAQSGTWTVQPGNTANTTAWKVDGSAVTQPVSMATNTPLGTVAHDGVDSGAPVKVGTRAVSTLATATMVSAADRADSVADLDGALLVRLNFPLGDLKSERVTDTAGTSVASAVFTAVASTRNVVTSLAVYNSSATAGFLDFRDGTAGSVLWTMPLPAGGGSVLSDPTGMFRTSANTALAYDVSGALTTVYISVSGFQSKV